MSALRVLALFALLALAWLTVTPSAMAQEPSSRLQDLTAIARDLYAAGAYADATTAAERAFAQTEAEFGASHERTGIQAFGLALSAEMAGQYDVAERAYARVVAIREAVYGRDSAAVAMALEKLAEMLVRQGRPDAAEPHARRALLLRQAVIGPDHPFAAPGHAVIGHIASARGDWQAALASYREAVRLLALDNPTQVSARTVADRLLEGQRETFVGLVRAAHHLRGTGTSVSAQQLADESFMATQKAWNTAAAGALAKMTARLGASDTELGRRVRQLQDRADRIVALNAEDMALLAGWSDVQRQNKVYSDLLEQFRARSIENSRVNAPAIARQRALVEDLQKLLARCPPGQVKAGCEQSTADREAITRELGQLSTSTSAGASELMALHKQMEAAERALPGYQEFTAKRARLRAEIDSLERSVAEGRGEIVRSYPAYAALAEPGALRIAEAQALLREGEALVVFLVGADTGYVFAIDRTRMMWAAIEGGATRLSQDVRTLRAGLDPLTPDGWTRTPDQTAEAFDLERAYGLYRRLLGPVENVIAGKSHVMLVPAGPLTSLPIQVLVAAPPSTSGSPADRLRSAEWLVRRHALSVLPSVASLKALRRLPQSGIPVRPFLGIGDPKLDGPDQGRARSAPAPTLPARFYRNGLADVRALRQLAPLPDTAQEVTTVASVLGATPADVLLGPAATEAALRRLPLKDYRIVHFATHGLVAGDLSDLGEPALVLSPPDTPTESDDGLLTASEVATLSFDAEWVVLSACNTAAGQANGAEALSGLARAFFYAGARALLVSHWSVYSEAATRLTTETFARLAANPAAGRAEAFRQAMLAEVDAGKPPSYWAPFVIVGDGR